MLLLLLLAALQCIAAIHDAPATQANDSARISSQPHTLARRGGSRYAYAVVLDEASGQRTVDSFLLLPGIGSFNEDVISLGVLLKTMEPLQHDFIVIADSSGVCGWAVHHPDELTIESSHSLILSYSDRDCLRTVKCITREPGRLSRSLTDGGKRTKPAGPTPHSDVSRVIWPLM
jgi:hypothetical protein